MIRRTEGIVIALFCLLVFFAVVLDVSAQSSPSAAPTADAALPQAVVDGGVGPCAVEFTVETANGKPVAAANVKVHIAYGFGGFHKLDLEAGTNSEGKVRFTGLPARVRRPPLEFEASKDQLAGTATLDPATECQARRDIRLAEKKTGVDSP